MTMQSAAAEAVAALARVAGVRGDAERGFRSYSAFCVRCGEKTKRAGVRQTAKFLSLRLPCAAFLCAFAVNESSKALNAATPKNAEIRRVELGHQPKNPNKC